MRRERWMPLGEHADTAYSLFRQGYDTMYKYGEWWAKLKVYVSEEEGSDQTSQGYKELEQLEANLKRATAELREARDNYLCFHHNLSDLKEEEDSLNARIARAYQNFLRLKRDVKAAEGSTLGRFPCDRSALLRNCHAAEADYGALLAKRLRDYGY